MRPHHRQKKKTLPQLSTILGFLLVATYRRDWDMMLDLIVVLRRGLGIAAPKPTKAEGDALRDYFRAIAKASRSGIDLPGCGHPECRACMPDVIRDHVLEDLGVIERPPEPVKFIVQFQNGGKLVLDSAPMEGVPFHLMLPPPGWH